MADTALGTAVSGLSVTQARINTISRNIANASTEGYSRKIQEQVTGPKGSVFPGRITRAVDEALARSLRESTGNLARFDAVVEFGGLIETNFGSPDENSSIAGTLGKLESALRDAAVSPEKATLYNGVVNAGTEVARSFNRLYDAAEEIKRSAVDRINEAVNDVNTSLERIRQLNLSIVGGTQGLDTTDLQDQRDQEMLKLSEILDFTSFKQANGAVNIYTRQGQVLLDMSVRPISTAMVAAQPSVPPIPGQMLIRGGRLGGLLSVRDEVIPRVETQLDDIARAITVEFDAIGVPLFNDAGTTPLDPLDPLQINGYARRIAVNDVIRATPTLIRDGNSPTPLPPGDSAFVQMAVDIFGRSDVAFTAPGLPALGGIVQVTTDFVAGTSSERADAESAREYEKALKESFETKISGKIGVNVDQEMTALINLQQAYAANASIIQTTDELLNRLLSIL
jgi:flagellar hook-associated protein 1 FlgK